MNLWLNGSVGILVLQVSFEHGIDVLKILKGHSSKTSILDDFEFYEGRQKIMQEKKAKQRLLEKQVRVITQLLSFQMYAVIRMA